MVYQEKVEGILSFYRRWNHEMPVYFICRARDVFTGRWRYFSASDKNVLFIDQNAEQYAIVQETLEILVSLTDEDLAKALAPEFVVQ